MDHIIDIIDSFDEDFSIYIHMDKKYKLTEKERDIISNKKNIIFFSQKYKVNWSGFNLLKAQIYLFKKVILDKEIDYVHLISGQDFLVKSLFDFRSYFDKYSNTEFISYNQLPMKEWEEGSFERFYYYRFFDLFNYKSRKGKMIIDKLVDIQKKLKIKRRIPSYFRKLYGGSNWFSLSRICIEYIIEFTDQFPSFFNELKYTFAPEEVYYSTVVANSSFNDKVVNDNLRYICWKYRNGSFPANIDERDYNQIIDSKNLFARKFEHPHSKTLLTHIKNNILNIDCKATNQNSFEITSKGIWINNSLKGHCFDYHLAEALGELLYLMEVKTVVDLGCGPGWYVKALREKKFKVIGYDGNPHTEEISEQILRDGTKCYQLDLTENIQFDQKVDLILCIEVGEHIPSKYENVFIENLVNNTSYYLIVSWGTENQKGDGHINCRSNEYIINKICSYGFMENVPAKNFLRLNAKLKWFKESLLVFEKINYKN